MSKYLPVKVSNSVSLQKNQQPNCTRSYQLKAAIKLFLCFLIVIQCIFVTQCQAWEDMTIFKNPLIESRVLKLIKTSDSTFGATITFASAFPTVPSLSNMHFGIESMNYFCNYYVPTNQFEMYMDIQTPTDVTESGFKLNVQHRALRMKILVISVLVFANEYENVQYFESYQFQYISSTITYRNVPLAYPNAIVITYPVTIDYLSGSMSLIGYTLSVSINTSSYQRWRIYFDANVVSGKIKVRFFIYYPTIMPQMSTTNTNVYQKYANPVSASFLTLAMSIPTLIKNISAFLYGVRHFSYQPQNSSSRGIYFEQKWPSSTQSVIYLDNQMQMIHYQSLIINSFGCKNSLFPFKHFDSALSKIVCFEQCPPGTGGIYSNIFNSYICIDCDSNCVSCSNSTVCSQCETGYELTETYNCVLKPNYFINTSGTFPCSAKIPECVNCSPNGLVCSSCIKGFTVNLGVCYSCYNIDSYCSACNSTSCLQCQSPYTLIDPIKCGIQVPIPPPVPPICTSNLCQTCNTKNLSKCLACKYPHQSTLIDGVCFPFQCGNGKIDPNETCDDSNTDDFDGCSSDCLNIQAGFKCNSIPSDFTYPWILTSDCFYQKLITLTLKSINKIKSENKVQIIIKNQDNNIRAWENISSEILKSIISFTFPSLNRSQQFAYDVSFQYGNQLNLTHLRSLQQIHSFNPANYEFIKLSIFYGSHLGEEQQQKVSLNHHLISVKINPSASLLSSFRFLSVSKCQFSLITDNNQIVQFYDSSYHAQGKVIYIISLTISIIFITMIVMSIVLQYIDNVGNSRKVWISLEGAFIVQFTYFSLIGIGELNPLFVEMAEGLQYSCGYDLTFSEALSGQIRQLSGIGILQKNLSSNVNISYLIVTAFILVGLVIYGIKRIRSKFIRNPSNEGQIEGLNDNIENIQVVSNQSKMKFDIIFVGNFGFTLLLFFSIKFCFFMCIELIDEDIFSAKDLALLIGIMSLMLGYLILIICKPKLFKSVNEKINFRTSQPNSNLFQLNESEETFINKNTIKKVYPIMVMLTQLINVIILVTLYESVFWSLCPISIYLIWIFFSLKLPFHSHAHQIRFTINNFIGLLIQCILMARHIMIRPNNMGLGKQEIQFGVYLPFTVIFLLLLMTLNSLVYFVYGIKRLRCCELSIDWEKRKQTTKKVAKANVTEINYSQTNRQLTKINKSLTIQVLKDNFTQKNNNQEGDQNALGRIKARFNKQETNQEAQGQQKMYQQQSQVRDIQEEIEMQERKRLEMAQRQNLNLEEQQLKYESQGIQGDKKGDQSGLKKLREIKKEIKQNLSLNKLKKAQVTANQKSNKSTNYQHDYHYTDRKKYVTYQQYDKI